MNIPDVYTVPVRRSAKNTGNSADAIRYSSTSMAEITNILFIPSKNPYLPRMICAQRQSCRITSEVKQTADADVPF